MFEKKKKVMIAELESNWNKYVNKEIIQDTFNTSHNQQVFVSFFFEPDKH